jgi:hypothetical protein
MDIGNAIVNKLKPIFQVSKYECRPIERGSNYRQYESQSYIRK